jgi:hypothetical protein
LTLGRETNNDKHQQQEPLCWTYYDRLHNNNTSNFHDWLARQGKTKRTIKEYTAYSRRICSILQNGDASIILDTIKPQTRHHVLSALANYAKYTGRYELFNQIRKNYNLKWTKPDSVQAMHRFFNEELSLEAMLQRIRNMMANTPRRYPKYCDSLYLLGSGLQKL